MRILMHNVTTVTVRDRNTGEGVVRDVFRRLAVREVDKEKWLLQRRALGLSFLQDGDVGTGMVGSSDLPGDTAKWTRQKGLQEHASRRLH
jgi:hypothetical protein